MNSKKTSGAFAALIAAAAAFLLASTPARAWAKDSLSVTVTPLAGDTVAVVNNGQATGTIQLFYTVNAQQFPTGFFTTFDIDWTTVQGRQATNYGTGVAFTLVQDQQGGHVSLWPAPDTFSLTHAGQGGKSTVSVYVQNDKNGNPPSSADGTDLVGNLKLDAGSSVNSVTNVQVHVRLVHPSVSCLRVYNFVTDQEFAVGILDTTDIKVGTAGAKKGLVTSSTPGQYSDNVLVVNTCGAPETFHLGIAPDPSFNVKPQGQPVVAYTSAGEFDTTNFGTLMLGTGTNHQQNLCLQNVFVPAASSLLVTVHSEATKDAPAASLPADDTFDFAASLFESVNAGCAGTLHPLAAPNAAAFVLPFTVNGQ